MIDLRSATLPADAVIGALNLRPHPEGGHYRETWREGNGRDEAATGRRAAGTAILFLLREDEVSHWHRVDASELWIWQAGAPLALGISPLGEEADSLRLGPDLGDGQMLQAVVPPHHWQSARSLGRWTLVSCVVAPAFSFSGFELAPPGWKPGCR